ncbi:hypothetical protein AAH161_22615, partial [Bacteroides ovatus]|uniref:hypothetical protein n=1 Tax=Bacteroides ovatus TaxID=28116 RepID=UPI0039B58432
MKKIKKVTRRAFTEKQLDMLEQYHYLYKKLWRIGLSEDESEWFFVKFGGNLFFISTVSLFFFLNPI